jgi:hypothetical protein
MATYNIIPNGGTFTDVADTLTANGGVGITSAQASTMFAKVANIRWDAKYKPVILAEYFPDRTKAWWKGTDGFCGMNLDNARHAGSAENLWDALVGKIDGKMNGWEYANPTGGASSPFRIADFGGYATKGKFIDGYYVPSKAGVSLSAAIRQPIGTENTLAWADFDAAWADANTTLSNFYFGAIMVRNGTTNFRARTSESPLTQSTEVVIPTNDLADGSTWTVMPFIFSGTILSDREHDKIGVFYTLPNTQLTTITKSSTKPSITITAQKSEPVTIAVNLKILNVTDSAMRFETNTVWLIHPDSSIENPSTLDKSVTIPDFEVAANGTHTIEVKFEFLDILTYNNGLVYVTLNAGTYEYGPFIPDISAGPKTL